MVPMAIEVQLLLGALIINNMKKKPWMLFRTEHSFVHYFWDGHYPYLVNVPGNPKDPAPYFWGAQVKSLVDASEEQGTAILNEVAANPRKKIFTITGHKQRYVVVTRGTFEEE